MREVVDLKSEYFNSYFDLSEACFDIYLQCFIMYTFAGIKGMYHVLYAF